MRRVVKRGAILIAFLVVAFAAWLAWDQRPYEREDWRAAFLDLQVRHLCFEADVLTNMLEIAGVAQSQLKELKAHGTSDYCRRGVKTVSGTKPQKANSNDGRQDPGLPKVTAKETNAEEKAFLDRWHLRFGWQSVGTFAIDHWQRPDLVAGRGLAWIMCSHTELFSKPVNLSLINRAVYFFGEGHRQLPPTRLEQRRKWCGNTLSYLSRELESGLPYTERRFALDAAEFGNHDATIEAIQKNSYVLKDRYRPLGMTETEYRKFRQLFDLHRLASHHLNTKAMSLLARQLYEEPVINSAKVKEAFLLSAFWSTIAIDQGADAQAQLELAEDRLSSDDRAFISELTDCWYQLSGTGLLIDPVFSGLHADSVHEDPRKQLDWMCDANEEYSLLNQLNRKPEP